MFLPHEPLQCIRALESAGFSAYAVGGCVRDALLGLTPQDYDLCTNATPEQICQVFHQYRQIRNGEKHGTVGIIMEGGVYEITTFRTEGGYQDNRHPDWVKFVTRVEDDLARRDFTVNAMAYSPSTGYIDPWGGRQDLQNKCLRAVGEPERRFTEDSLRILRGIRFAVRYGLTPDPATEKAMFALAPLMENLAVERIFEELCKFLLLAKAEDLIRFAPVITQAIPALKASIGFQQQNPHHAYDVYTHTAHVVAAVPAVLSLRWAALLHDIAKPATFTLDSKGIGHFLGHAEESAQVADQVLRQLKAPTALRQEVVFIVEKHMMPLPADRRVLVRRLGKYGETALQQLLQLQQADFSSKGTGVTQDPALKEVAQLMEQILQEQACLNLKNLNINGSDLLAAGFAPGPELGICLNRLLELVQDEQLPNEKQALLQAALTMKN